MSPTAPQTLAPEASTDHPGYVYVWEPERNWSTRWMVVADPARLCRYTVGPGHAQCKAPTVAAMLRGSRWWHYCGEHLYGRRLVDGIIWHRVLRKEGAS